MTERALPAIVAGGTSRGAAPAASVRVTARKGEALLSTPTRAGMLMGVSAAVYALTLASVAGLQTAEDAAVAARRQPLLDAVASVQSTNDALEANLAPAIAGSRVLADVYAETGDRVSMLEARLDALADLVGEVRGSAASLPDRIDLPSVTVRRVPAAGRPATHATTGASGG